MKSRGTRLLLPGAALGFALALAPVQHAPAQESGQKAEAPATVLTADAAKPDKSVRMTRTGSNITRVRTDESLPLTEIDRAYIERTGVTNTPDLLRTIPQVQVGR